jgi:hypothetical protein
MINYIISVFEYIYYTFFPKTIYLLAFKNQKIFKIKCCGYNDGFIYLTNKQYYNFDCLVFGENIPSIRKIDNYGFMFIVGFFNTIKIFDDEFKAEMALVNYNRNQLIKDIIE